MIIRERFGKEILFFDGAMGTMLQKSGLLAGEIPETYNMLQPNKIIEIHQKYIKAGANIITANTFGANEYKLKGTNFTVEEIVESGVNIAKKAGNGKYVALDVGPIGQLLEPMGILCFEEAYNIFKRQIVAGYKAGCNLILIETMTDVYEAKAAVLAAKENTDLPILCTMTFGEDGRTLSGTDPLTMVTILESLGVDALGVNCSFGPKEIKEIIREICKYAHLPIMVQPNAGLPQIQDGKLVYSLGPEEFAINMKDIAQMGASILGGCCGTDERYIEETVKLIKGMKVVKTDGPKITTLCSSSKTIIIDEGAKVASDRINPTGKKDFKEALENEDVDFLLNQVVKQKDSGVDFIDINLGLPGIDEKGVMVKAIKEIQAIINTPLQIDSSDSKVIEASVRVYNGKPIINSVNGRKEIMEKIFPIVKKYGACVIGLTLDENGVPSTAEERFAIAKRIVNKAQEYGIPKENILIDSLVLTVSAQQKEAIETLKTVRLVKERLGVKTLLGITNISFGLPSRGLLDRTYLSMALAMGVDAVIINPMDREAMNTVYAYRVIDGEDIGGKNYVGKIAPFKENCKLESQGQDKSLKHMIISGLKEETANATRELLNFKNSLEIIEEYLIPALDEVGKKYEEGEMFLPQLIQSAETVKSAFDIIKNNIKEQGKQEIYKGKIILATVQGDIHDIGKNIVKLLLENYGFKVIDLGKDVPVKKVVEEARIRDIKLIGLSALMTTTVKSMEETIKALKENGLDVEVFVGGAVLNPDYAKNIGANYYAKDARESVKIAQEIFKESTR
ncbi:homocysteine S-methyltransferase family protein [Haloimpatiens massiliensis]|uniref:homocysteine S-methyltransferase family protein n=1 Tax=Haloimpatiens massiliensis TaxID=1658110 RepID=UPI0015E08319|nr:homocysteine S-methyltransferase family protein [Haloimpatiens massiliensis]